MNRLSIIVPLYNSARYLPKCLDSLLCQDIPYSDYSIILVNDGSPDNSVDIATDYAQRYENIVVISQTNKGTSGARNIGLRYADSKYVYFVDPDDYILEHSLAVPLAQMDSEDLDILRFAYCEVNEQYEPTRSCKHPETPDYSPRIMDGATFMSERLGTACYVWTFIFRLSVIKNNNIFFYEGDYFDDTPWLPRVFLHASRVNSIDFHRHFYLIRQNSLVQSKKSTSISRKIDGQRFLINELCNQEKKSGSVQASRWYRMMLAHCVLTLLTLVSRFDYNGRKTYIHELKQLKVFPVSRYRANWENSLKMSIINISPTLFCFLIKISNK